MSTITIVQTPGGEDPDDATFASVDEVRLRMGRAEFTEAETAQVEYLLALAASAIASDLGYDDSWSAELEAVPTALRTTSIEMVQRIMSNPGGVRSRQETLGSHSLGETYADATAALEITERESLRCHRAVFGSTTASARMGSVLDSIGPDLGDTGSRFTIAEETGEVTG